MTKQPHLLVEEGDVSGTALIPGDPGRAGRITEQYENVEEVVQNRKYKIVNAKYEGIPLTVPSTGTGCPSAAIAVKKLARVGVETFIRVGIIGALQTDIEVDGMIVATNTAKEEGISKCYESEVYPTVPDYDVLTSLADSAEASDENVRVGPIISDDAFYGEPDEYVEDWNDTGLLATEMEAATMFSLIRHRGLRIGATYTVDGNLVADTQKGADSDEEPPEKAKNNVERAIPVSLDAVADLT